MAENRLKIIISADSANADGALRRTADSVRVVGDAGRKAESDLSLMRRGSDGLRQSLDSLKIAAAGVITGIGLGQAAQQFIATADAMRALDNRLLLTARNTADYAAAQQSVIEIQRQSHQELAAVGTMYTRLALATKDLNVTQAELADVTRGVNLAVAMSGATAAESTAGMLQFAQAMSLGKLQGDEFRSVMENVPTLGMAIIDGMGLTMAEFRQQAEQGMITTERMIEAIKKKLPELEAQAKGMPVTVGMAMNDLRAAVSLYIAEVDRSHGITMAMAGAIGHLGANIDTIAKGGVVVLAGGLSLLAMRGLASVAAGLPVVIARLRELATVTETATVMTSSLSMATATTSRVSLAAAATRLATMPGVIGAVTTALSMGATAWAIWGREAEAATDSIDKKLDEIKRANQMLKEMDDPSIRLDQAAADVDAARKRLESLPGPQSISTLGGSKPGYDAAAYAKAVEELRKYEQYYKEVQDNIALAAKTREGKEIASILSITEFERRMAAERTKAVASGLQKELIAIGEARDKALADARQKFKDKDDLARAEAAVIARYAAEETEARRKAGEEAARIAKREADQQQAQLKRIDDALQSYFGDVEAMQEQSINDWYRYSEAQSAAFSELTLSVLPEHEQAVENVKRRYAELEAMLPDLYIAGKISWEQATAFQHHLIYRLRDDLAEIEAGNDQAASAVSDSWAHAMESIQDSLADMLYEFDFSMSSMVDLARRGAANAAAALIMDPFTRPGTVGAGGSGSGGSWGGLGNLFSGAGWDGLQNSIAFGLDRFGFGDAAWDVMGMDSSMLGSGLAGLGTTIMGLLNGQSFGQSGMSGLGVFLGGLTPLGPVGSLLGGMAGNWLGDALGLGDNLERGYLGTGYRYDYVAGAGFRQVDSAEWREDRNGEDFREASGAIADSLLTTLNTISGSFESLFGSLGRGSQYSDWLDQFGASAGGSRSYVNGPAVDPMYGPGGLSARAGSTIDLNAYISGEDEEEIARSVENIWRAATSGIIAPLVEGSADMLAEAMEGSFAALDLSMFSATAADKLQTGLTDAIGLMRIGEITDDADLARELSELESGLGQARYVIDYVTQVTGLLGQIDESIDTAALTDAGRELKAINDKYAEMTATLEALGVNVEATNLALARQGEIEQLNASVTGGWQDIINQTTMGEHDLARANLAKWYEEETRRAEELGLATELLVRAYDVQLDKINESEAAAKAAEAAQALAAMTAQMEEAAAEAKRWDDAIAGVNRTIAGVERDIATWGMTTGELSGWLTGSIASARAAFSAADDYDEAIAGYQEVEGLILERWRTEQQYARELTTTYQGLFRIVDQIKDKSQSLTYSQYNLALDDRKQASAAADYARLFGLARTGDADAKSSYLGFVDTYLQTSMDVYKSSPAYQAIYRQVQDDLGSLGVTTLAQGKSAQEEATERIAKAGQETVDELKKLREELGKMKEQVGRLQAQIKVQIDGQEVADVVIDYVNDAASRGAVRVA